MVPKLSVVGWNNLILFPYLFLRPCFLFHVWFQNSAHMVWPLWFCSSFGSRIQSKYLVWTLCFWSTSRFRIRIFGLETQLYSIFHLDLANVVWTPAFVPGLLPEFDIFGLDTLCFVPGLVPEQTGQVQKNWTAQPAENHSGIVVFYRLCCYVVNEYIELFTSQSLITEPFSGYILVNIKFWQKQRFADSKTNARRWWKF